MPVYTPYHKFYLTLVKVSKGTNLIVAFWSSLVHGYGKDVKMYSSQLYVYQTH